MDNPDCKECGKEMDYWSTLNAYYCKRCSMIYDPQKDKYWKTEEE
ncbi:MAG: hypothetical protein ACLFUR_04665 [Candidatus Hadarchaeia archaeon]